MDDEAEIRIHIRDYLDGKLQLYGEHGLWEYVLLDEDHETELGSAACLLICDYQYICEANPFESDEAGQAWLKEEMKKLLSEHPPTGEGRE